MKLPLIITIIVLVLIIAGVLIFLVLSGGEKGEGGQTVPAGSSGEYNCDTDTYNCGDFDTQAQAQEAYDSCLALGFGDIHNLDADGDGEVCEGLK